MPDSSFGCVQINLSLFFRLPIRVGSPHRVGWGWGWLSLGISRIPHPHNSQPSQKQLKFGVKTHKQPVCVLLEG